MTLRFSQIDAFTDVPYKGNPAAVFLLDDFLPDAKLQSIAREMNLSETAFLVRKSANRFQLRWFTPSVEVKLCGHATLASTHYLRSRDHTKEHSRIEFETKSGILQASFEGNTITLRFPSLPPVACPVPPVVVSALKIEPLFAGEGGTEDLLVEVESERTVRQLEPDFGLLKKKQNRGVLVTARSSSPGIDFVSRCFFPAVGVDEDPVTGSAHCVLGPYWANKLGRSKVRGYQASARGGYVDVTVEEDTVLLGGSAVTVFEGELLRMP